MTTEATTIDANPASSDADTTTAEEAPTTTPLTADTAQTLRHDVDANKNFGLITSLEQLQAFADRLIKANTPIGFDIETGYDGPPQESGSLFPQYGGFVVGFSFTNDEKWARYVPLRHDDSEKNLDNKRVAEIWWPVYSSGLLVAHNLAFEQAFMSRYFREHLFDHPEYGPQVEADKGYVTYKADSMIYARLSARYQEMGLKALSSKVFGYDQASLESLVPDLPKNQMKFFRFNPLPLSPDVVSYACDDAVWCLSLYRVLKKYVDNDFIVDLDHRLSRLLNEMGDEDGLIYDWDRMEAYLREAESFADVLHAEIMGMLTERLGTPQNINLNAPLQVAKLFYDDLGLPPAVDSKTGKRTTNAKAVAPLARLDPIVAKILEWKEVRKLISSYLSSYLKKYRKPGDPPTHPRHNQVRVASGRLAVSDPNYQQSPSTKTYKSQGRTLQVDWRSMIVPPPGSYLLGFDYSQLELRVLAGLSQDTALLDAFASGADIHQATASKMFGIDISEVSSSQRSAGKTANFSVIYGQGESATADMLDMTRDEVREFLDAYFSAFPAVKPWMESVVAKGYENRYVTTYFGRKVPIFEFESSLGGILAKGERLCVNASVQGTAGDIARIAMLRIDALLKREGLIDDVRMVMNIHDALYFYVDTYVDPEDLAELLRPAVELAIPKFPRLETDWAYGKTWSKNDLVDIERKSQ